VIEGEADRIERLLNQWLFVSRPEPPALAERDVGELVAATLRGHAARLQHAGVEVELARQGELTVACDGKRLAHVFDNLVTNAIQAMPRGGPLLVALTGDAAEVRIEFADRGTGFSPAALARFGEYFFSEKEGGMGIGLGVAREIVEAHGGTLRAENLAAGGARVIVVLPRTGP